MHDQRLALQERSILLSKEQRARLAAEEANRQKDEFVAVISHELRTPLNAILGWASLLRVGGLPAERSAEAIERIERNARRQSELVEDLLDISRIVGGKLQLEREPVRLAAAVGSALEALRPQLASRGVDLRFEGVSSPAMVLGSAARLEQVASNLVSNALKFSSEGGRVTVRLACEEDRAVLEVSDEGVGIAPELLPHVFDRFRQADSSTTRRHTGLGLGLAIVRHLVTLHGGTVTAHSEGLGRGARFTIRLPLMSSGEGRISAIPAPPEPLPSLRGMSVLVVDDDLEAQELLATALLSCGATLTVVGSVAEALGRLAQSSPDVIVSDIAMPEVDGFALASRVRALADPELARTPMIAVTAHASLPDRDRALDVGFDRYVAKPLRPSVLAREILELTRLAS